MEAIPKGTGWRVRPGRDPRTRVLQAQEVSQEPAWEAVELRCGCRSLLARWVPGGIELKCRRCKRVQVVPVPAGP